MCWLFSSYLTNDYGGHSRHSKTPIQFEGGSYGACPNLLFLVLLFILASFLTTPHQGRFRAQADQARTLQNTAGRRGLCCSAFASTAIPARATATASATGQASPARADPPGTIDGAKNPELIPDEVAYRLVLLALAEPENPTDAQRARFQTRIASAKLSEEDSKAFLPILGTFQKQLDALNARADQIRARNPIPLAGTPDYQSLVDLSKQREPVFVEAMSGVPARLSAEGYAKLQTYIQNAKRGMKYLPDITPMPGQ